MDVLTHMCAYTCICMCMAALLFVCTILWLQEAAVASLKGSASSSIPSQLKDPDMC